MMFKGIRGTRASDHLDMVRGIAAVAVLWYHVRYRFFLDFNDLANPGLLARAWYAFTAFGHDAVMVFFVVSGFLVGSAAIRDRRAGRWSWSDYLIARLVRLYVVLVPGLLLTMFWDRLGLHLFGENAIYSGAPQWYRHDYFDVASRAGLQTMIGNAAFLQTIRVPTFGSNDALWSLAFEFWYYIAFPMFAVALIGPSSLRARLAWFCAGAVVLYGIGGLIAVYFPLWLLGAAVGLLPSCGPILRRSGRSIFATGMAFGAWLVVSHTPLVRNTLGNSLWAVDSCTGVLFAVWLYALAHDRRAARAGAYGIVARRLANASYTLYVVHLPLLIFLRGWLVPANPWTPSPESLLVSVAIVAVALAYALAIASVTERHTATIRQAVRSRFAGLVPVPAGKSAAVSAREQATTS